MLPWLPAEACNSTLFPPLDAALQQPNGLLAAGGDLSPSRLIAAYRGGIFPWYSPGDPILWWSPDPRMVLAPSDFICRRSLTKTLRNARYSVRLDTAFDAVMTACATTQRDGQNGTWITDEIREAYGELHRLGHAHSVETWIDGKLVGGLYGIAIGKAFFGESMFAHARDASKIAFAHLCEFLRRRDFGIIDCQMETTHLHSLGARPIARHDFVQRIAQLRDLGDAPACWAHDAIDGCFREQKTQ